MYILQIFSLNTVKKIGKTRSDNCRICNVCDFIEHFFFSCLGVKPLWNLIESLLHVKLVATDVMFGYTVTEL